MYLSHLLDLLSEEDESHLKVLLLTFIIYQLTADKRLFLLRVNILYRCLVFSEARGHYLFSLMMILLLFILLFSYFSSSPCGQAWCCYN